MGRAWGWVFPGDVGQVQVVRAAVAAALPRTWPRRADVEQVAAELACNSIRHSSSAGRCFAVEMTLTPAAVELAVHDDGGADAPRLLDPPDPLDDDLDLPVEAFEHGRGLRMVDACCDAWGSDDSAAGRTVWTQFRRDPAAAAPPSGDEAGSEHAGPDGIPQPHPAVRGYLRNGRLRDHAPRIPAGPRVES